MPPTRSAHMGRSAPQRGSGGTPGRGRGGGRGRGRGGAASPLQLKKAKTKFHQERFRKEREGGESAGSRGSRGGSRGGGRGGQRGGYRGAYGTQAQSAPSHRTNTVDIHLASKVSQDLRQDISQFKARHAAADLFGPELNAVFGFVSPIFIQQHLPDAVEEFKTYLPRFNRGSASLVSAFAQWYEWASYERTKGRSFARAGLKGAESQEEADEADRAPEDAAGDEKVRKMSASRQALAQTLKEREHVRALLQMCLRHNASRRREGQHALLNHLNAKLVDADGETLERLRSTAHHSVVYALSRLVLGMATEDFAMIVLHCHALFLVLKNTRISPSVILSLMDEELALTARMTAARLRLDSGRGKAAKGDLGDDADVEDVVDPDDLNDPTKGERNQRLTAAVFGLAAVVAAKRPTSVADARRLSTFLCFCYVQQKATRILSSSTLFMHFKEHPKLLADSEAMTWLTFAFFYFPRLEYFRPEAVQCVLRLMTLDDKSALAATCLPATVTAYLALDPLAPTTVEQLVGALFRKEQVTACHPMVHPVWGDFFDIIVQRCAMGESLKEHLGTFVHAAIAPYRRGNSDIARRTLFQNLVTRLGQIAVQSVDSEERVDLLHMASKSAGYGVRTSAKPTPLLELRRLPVAALTAKVGDLLKQYAATKDRDPAARTNRTWVLRELRNCLYVPVLSGVVKCPYVNESVMALLAHGFYPSSRSSDETNKNRCIYLFADVFSFTYEAAKTRPQCTVSGLEIIRAYLDAESAHRTRFNTSVAKKSFCKARNRIVETLESAASKRSVLFYDFRDMEVLLTLLFLVLSVEDPTNSDGAAFAATTVPDLAQFCLSGTLETLDVFMDVLMALVMRASSPLQVMPLMTCVRRIATGYILKFAPYITTKYTLDIVLSPLRDAFHTDSRELSRLRKTKSGEEEEVSEDDNSDAELDEDASTKDEESEGSEDDESTDKESTSSDDAASNASEDAATATDATDSATEEDDNSTVNGDNEDAASDAGDDASDDDEDELEEEEAPTQQFVDALKGMIGNTDLEHAYPVDTANKEKSDVARAIHLAARVGVSLTSPNVIHVYQVLLAVCRETVKSSDSLLFDAAMSALDMLFLSKNRYFGHFLQATDLFQLLGDIQSYARKLDRTLFSKEAVTARAAAQARRRLQKLKAVAVRVMHFLSMLAYKNHASEEVRITISEFYKSVFCDRGWDMKRLLPGLKKDLFHYRQGFAWAILPSAFEKFSDVAAVNSPQRVRVFTGCCTLVESMLSRLSGLPNELKLSASGAIRGFLQSVTLQQVYAMKHTLPHAFLHTIKMVVQYNSRVHLETEWVANQVVAVAVDDDSIQLSRASVRLVAALERLLGLTSRAMETKPPVPVKVLYEQFEKVGTKAKAEYYRKNKRAREKALKALLAYRNNDQTDEERAAKRRRREELKVEDRLQRQVIREAKSKLLTKEEREEKRKNILVAKQERIAKNRERKRRLHEVRQKSFDRWREGKLAAAAAAADESIDANSDD